MARRQYGTGTVYQRSDGKWVGRFDAGYTPSGGRRRKTVTGPTEADTKRLLRIAIREHESGQTTLNPRLTVKAWSDQWLTRQKARVRPATYTADQSAIRQWIVPTIGKKRLTELTPGDLRRVTDAVIAKRARSTALRVHSTMQGMLKAASLEGHTIPAPIFQMTPPEQERSDRTDISVPEALRLLQTAADDPLRSRWVAALLQGMRQAECLGLTWDDVDLETGTLTIQWQLQPLTSEHGCGGTCRYKRAGYCPQRRFRVPVGFEREQIDGRWHLVRPKTRAGTRAIPLVPWMHAALQQWHETAPESRLVWPTQDGRPRDPKDDLKAWHDLQEQAGVRHPSGRYYHLHEARHATASILVAMGVDTAVIIAIMGHASILSTRTYTHVRPAQIREALDGVATMLQLTT